MIYLILIVVVIIVMMIISGRAEELRSIRNQGGMLVKWGVLIDMLTSGEKYQTELLVNNKIHVHFFGNDFRHHFKLIEAGGLLTIAWRAQKPYPGDYVIKREFTFAIETPQREMAATVIKEMFTAMGLDEITQIMLDIKLDEELKRNIQ